MGKTYREAQSGLVALQRAEPGMGAQTGDHFLCRDLCRAPAISRFHPVPLRCARHPSDLRSPSVPQVPSSDARQSLGPAAPSSSDWAARDPRATYRVCRPPVPTARQPGANPAPTPSPPNSDPPATYPVPRPPAPIHPSGPAGPQLRSVLRLAAEMRVPIRVPPIQSSTTHPVLRAPTSDPRVTHAASPAPSSDLRATRAFPFARREPQTPLFDKMRFNGVMFHAYLGSTGAVSVGVVLGSITEGP